MDEPRKRALEGSHDWSLVVFLLAVAACDASTPHASLTAVPDAAQDHGSDAGAADQSAIDSGGPLGDASDALGGGDSGLVAVDADELPRVAADPTLTHRLVPGQVELEGDTFDSCSNAMPLRGDRWCAFSRRIGDTRTELWALNFTKAATAGPVPCDGTSPDCLLLNGDLWVDFQIWGDSQPVVHRFEGDTLIFHAGPAPGKRDPYDGGIWAWRPGWSQPRQLTDHGVFCFANPRSASIACIANATIDKDFSDPFAIPYYRQFDILAGVLSDVSAGPLPIAAHVTHAPDDRSWRVRFSPDGQYLAFSNVATSGTPETVKVIKVSEAGTAVPTTVVTGASEWEIALDGMTIYYLAGYDRTLGTAATGTLKAADFPVGSNTLELTTMVRSFELVGTFDRVFRPEDRGLVAVTSVPGGLQPILMRQPRASADIFQLDPGAMSIDVASDLRHSAYFKPVMGNPVIMVARNDGSGVCQLTADTKAESYAVEFTESGASVLWVERLRRATRSEQGWLARPDDCGARFQFGDHVLDYQLAGDDFVVFQGSNASSSSWWLEYTRLPGNAAGGSSLPTIIREHPDVNVHIIRDAAGTWIVFSVPPQAAEPEPGLYLHGPLQP